MTADILNRKLEVLGITDDYRSFIWTERYNQYSDFEIELTATAENRELYAKKNLLSLSGSDKVMIIDTVEYNSAFADGKTMIVSGKSLEYILNDRLIWEETVLSGNVQNGIKQLLDENIISPTNNARKFPNLSFRMSSDPKVTSAVFGEESQYWGETLYDVVEEICKMHKLGFRITATDGPNYIFELFAGRDRTHDQTEYPAVVFSPEFGNLISSKYYSSDESVKTSALVLGERRTISETVEINGIELTKSEEVQYSVTIEGSTSGWDRKEVLIDQTSLSMFVKDIQVPPEKYKNRLRQKGEEALEETKMETTFEAEVDWNGQFKYGKDYKIGDILEVENEIEIGMKVRITEMVHCRDASGEYLNPAFTPLDEEND